MVVAGLVVHDERAEAATVACDVASWLLERGHEVALCPPDAERLDMGGHAVPEDRFSERLDVAISFGGDGTMLRTVDLVAGANVPVIGVNVGQLGYLTEVEPAGTTVALERFLAGDYGTEERMLLEIRFEGQEPRHCVAMNEAVVEKTPPSGHTVRLAVSVDGEFFTTYAADGLIVATPTGSTAYSFSARGPIVAPTHRCLVLTPVSPHMLFDRTLVLDPGSVLRIEVVGHRPATVSADGRSLTTLLPGEAMTCTASKRTAHVVTFGDHDFLAILKRKFGLADR